AHVSFLDRLNHKVAVFLVKVLGSRCVVFEFTVPPSVSTGLDGPLGRVRGRAVCSVEFVAPTQHPTWMARGFRRLGLRQLSLRSQSKGKGEECQCSKGAHFPRGDVQVLDGANDTPRIRAEEIPRLWRFFLTLSSTPLAANRPSCNSHVSIQAVLQAL